MLTPVADPAEERRKLLELLAALAAIGRPDDGIESRPDSRLRNGWVSDVVPLLIDTDIAIHLRNGDPGVAAAQAARSVPSGRSIVSSVPISSRAA